MMFFSFFCVRIDVDSRFESPPWRSDIGVDGFQFSHVFGVVSGDVFEV